jgi:hypothetical protein
MELTKRANQDAETAQIKHLTCWGIRKSDGAPEHKRWKTKEQTHERSSEVGDKESPKACMLLKSCEPLYMCPLASFYRETKELLHSEITLGYKEYSKWKHVHECLLYPVIYGTNFRYLQACHLFTPRTRTFDTTSLT